MNDAEIAAIRNRQGLCCCQSCTDRRALLAHIDALTAEITDREGKYVDLLRTNHALAAYNANLVESNHRCNDYIMKLEAEVEALKKAPNFQRGEQIIRTHADVIKRLQAEVERLKAHMAECDRQEILRVSSLRDLVREAGEIIERGSFCGCETYRPLGHSPNCGQKRADAWLEKAKA